MESHRVPMTDELTPLVEAVERGDTVIITRNGEAVAEIHRALSIPAAPSRRQPRPLDMEAITEIRRRIRLAGMPDLDAVALVRAVRDEPE